MVSISNEANKSEQLEELRICLKSYLVSQTGNDITVFQLNKFYREDEAENIPYRKFNFTSLIDFLNSFTDSMYVEHINGQDYVRAVQSEKSAHIQKLVAQQRSKKPSSKKSNGFGNRRRGFRRINKSIPYEPFKRIIIDKLYNKGEIKKNNVLDALNNDPSMRGAYFTLEDLNRQLAEYSHLVQHDRENIYLKNRSTSRPKYNTTRNMRPIKPSNSYNSQRNGVKPLTNHFSQSNCLKPLKPVNNCTPPLVNHFPQNGYTNSIQPVNHTIPPLMNFSSQFNCLNSTQITNNQSTPRSNGTEILTNNSLDNKKFVTGCHYVQKLENNTKNLSGNTNHNIVNKSQFVNSVPVIEKVSESSEECSNYYSSDHYQSANEFDYETEAELSNAQYKEQLEDELIKQVSTASDLISERTKFRLQKLIEKHIEGIWSSDLPEAYFDEYRINLEYNELGFDDIIQFVSALPEIFTVIETPDTHRCMILDARRPINQSTQNRPEKSLASIYNIEEYINTDKEAIPINLSSHVTQNLIPEGVMGLNDTIEQYCVTNFEIGEMYEVNISEVFTPSFFWITVRKNRKKITALYQELHAFYEGVDLANYKIPQAVLKPGLNIACLYGDDKNCEWHRGIIKKVKSDGYVTVLFYDYGTVKTYHPKRIFYLSKRFTYMPAQAIPCGLVNIKPYQRNDWSQGVIQVFMNKIWGIPFVCTVALIDVENNSMMVTLTDTSDDEIDFHVNDWMIEKKYAERGRMENSIPLRDICSYDEAILRQNKNNVDTCSDQCISTNDKNNVLSVLQQNFEMSKQTNTIAGAIVHGIVNNPQQNSNSCTAEICADKNSCVIQDQESTIIRNISSQKDFNIDENSNKINLHNNNYESNEEIKLEFEFKDGTPTFEIIPNQISKNNNLQKDHLSCKIPSRKNSVSSANESSKFDLQKVTVFKYNFFKKEKLSSIHVFHLNNTGYVDAQEFVQGFTNLFDKQVLFGLLELYPNVKIEYKILSRDDYPNLFGCLDQHSVNLDRDINFKVADLHLIPTGSILRILSFLKFIDHDKLKEAALLKRQTKNNNLIKLLQERYGDTILYDAMALVMQHRVFASKISKIGNTVK